MRAVRSLAKSGGSLFGFNEGRRLVFKISWTNVFPMKSCRQAERLPSPNASRHFLPLARAMATALGVVLLFASAAFATDVRGKITSISVSATNPALGTVLIEGKVEKDTNVDLQNGGRQKDGRKVQRPQGWPDGRSLVYRPCVRVIPSAGAGQRNRDSADSLSKDCERLVSATRFARSVHGLNLLLEPSRGDKRADLVVRSDENISAIHERRVNIADADVVTLASNPQTPSPRIAMSDVGTVAAKMTSLKNKVRENVQQTKSDGCRKKERPPIS
jgi:hypothetical protein